MVPAHTNSLIVKLKFFSNYQTINSLDNRSHLNPAHVKKGSLFSNIVRLKPVPGRGRSFPGIPKHVQ